jgi:exosortase H (IPTLxxWG-CTERM-specific)
VTLMLWAAMLAFPSPWIQKLKGLAAGTVAIHLLNLVRIISLFYLGQYNTGWFDFAHLYIWESLIMLGTMVIFSLWVQQLRRNPPASV